MNNSERGTRSTLTPKPGNRQRIPLATGETHGAVSVGEKRGSRQPGAGRKPLREEKTLLGEWVERSGMSISDLARAVGISTSSFYELMGGRSEPRVTTAVKIEDLTKGEVPVRSWVK
jgi:DNA-binding XRE family transcriptional regulator